MTSIGLQASERKFVFVFLKQPYHSRAKQGLRTLEFFLSVLFYFTGSIRPTSPTSSSHSKWITSTTVLRFRGLGTVRAASASHAKCVLGLLRISWYSLSMSARFLVTLGPIISPSDPYSCRGSSRELYWDISFNELYAQMGCCLSCGLGD